MGKWIDTAIRIIMIVAIVLTLWESAKMEKLNQRYEDAVNRYEQSTKEYTDYLKQSKQEIEQLIDKARENR